MSAQPRPLPSRMTHPLAAPILLFLVLMSLLASPGQACMYSQPPPAACGKSLVISTAVPKVHLLPGGGSFDVTALVFFTMVDFPLGLGICPAGPYAVDVAVTVNCTPSGDGAGAVVGAPISTGFNELTVPVTVPAGPSRICDVEATATVTLGDGMVLTAVSDSLACLAEPAPGMPSEPRLDLELLGNPGAEVARAHPGDQSLFTYRVTNNDPTDSFVGELTTRSLNTARLPGASGPMPPATGVFSISDPVQGDNFPLAFTDQLFEGCVLLPADPANPAVPELLEPIVLGPGQSREIEIHSRSWGMCANGSCSRGTVAIEGSFSDETAGLACAGFITAADAGVPPTYGWPDAGEVGRGDIPSPGRLRLRGQPRPEEDREVEFEVAQLVLAADGVPIIEPAIVTNDLVDSFLVRTQLQIEPEFSIDDGATFSLGAVVNTHVPTGFDGSLLEMNALPGIPTGFSDVAPSGRGLVGLAPEDFPELDLFDFTAQIEGVGIDETGERRLISWANAVLARSPGGSGFRVELGGGQVMPGSGSRLEVLEIALDFRGFVSGIEQGELGEIFTDGFESGNVTSWSSSGP